MTQRTRISLEFFPPRTSTAKALLSANLAPLLRLAPAFATVSYGAGGSTRDGTFDLVRQITEEHGIDCAPHLSCVGMSKHALGTHIQDYLKLGITRIVALRGDQPSGYASASGEFESSWELVAALKDIAALEVAVGCYPEGHPDDMHPDDRFTYLEKKADAGADVAISQMFFETRHFLEFRERCARRRIALPVLPGIMPIHDAKQVLAFATKCGAVITPALRARFEGTTHDDAFAVARDIVVEQVRALVAEGVEHLHIYTLDRHALAAEICRAIA